MNIKNTTLNTISIVIEHYLNFLDVNDNVLFDVGCLDDFPDIKKSNEIITEKGKIYFNSLLSRLKKHTVQDKSFSNEEIIEILTDNGAISELVVSFYMKDFIKNGIMFFETTIKVSETYLNNRFNQFAQAKKEFKEFQKTMSQANNDFITFSQCMAVIFKYEEI